MFIFTISDFIALAILVILAIVAFINFIRNAIKQRKCLHEKYFETMACDAVCCSCGKNLGFIDSIRDK